MAIKKRPDETVDNMIKRFKKEVLKSGIIQEAKKREAYVAPALKRRKKREEARRKAMKKQNKIKLY